MQVCNAEPVTSLAAVLHAQCRVRHEELNVTSEAERLSSIQREPKDLLSEIKWHLLRYDTLRLSLASRGALILSANALVATGATVLAGQRASNTAVGLTLTAGTILTLILIGVSVSYATSAVINIRPWRKSYGNSVPLAMVYDASDTNKSVASFEEFAGLLSQISETDAANHAASNLWRVIVSYQIRYTRLRIAIHLLFMSLWLFLLTIAVQLTYSHLSL
jgi:hypothetical protein